MWNSWNVYTRVTTILAKQMGLYIDWKRIFSRPTQGWIVYKIKSAPIAHALILLEVSPVLCTIHGQGPTFDSYCESQCHGILQVSTSCTRKRIHIMNDNILQDYTK